jgi:hypothetical protein
MPLARYVFAVGAVLLALLLISNAYLAKPQVAAGVDVDSTIVRIHSNRKWPERIVYDTNAPTVVPPQTAVAEGNVAAPKSVIDSPAHAPERKAMAQVRPLDAIQPGASTPETRKSKPQHHRGIATRRATPHAVRMARQWRGGWFGNGFW